MVPCRYHQNEDSPCRREEDLHTSSALDKDSFISVAEIQQSFVLLHTTLSLGLFLRICQMQLVECRTKLNRLDPESFGIQAILQRLGRLAFAQIDVTLSSYAR